MGRGGCKGRRGGERGADGEHESFAQAVDEVTPCDEGRHHAEAGQRRDEAGPGQVVDASIVDGTAALSNFVHGRRNAGLWSRPPGHNLLDTGAPFYEVYTCADGREIAVGALEPKFYAELLRLSGMDGEPALAPEVRMDRAGWPAAKQRWAA